MAGTDTSRLSLVIVTPTGQVTKGEVTEITAPGLLGEFGVLPGHIPFLSAIEPGVLSYVENGQTRLLAVGQGFVEVGLSENVVVLCDSVASPDTIDAEEAAREELAAAEALATLSPVDQPAEYATARANLAWARARKETALRVKASQAH